MTAVLHPEKILKDLDELWGSLGKQDAVLRACSLTLVVATDAAEDDIGETLGRLMREYPSRAIVIRIREGNTEPSARVLADCWLAFGGRQQICSERIEIETGLDAVDEVSSVLEGLLVPDLPVVVWWRAHHLLEHAGCSGIASFATKLIVDSQSEPRLGRQINRIRSAAHGNHRVADLAWTRLTRWRESIAQLFDDPAHAAKAHAVDSVRIEYQGDFVPMSAPYLAAWMQRSLGPKVRISITRAGDAPRARLYRVSMSGKGVDLALTVEQDRSVEVHSAVRDSHGVMPSLTEFDLLREEMSLLGRDTTYEAVLESAAEFL